MKKSKIKILLALILAFVLVVGVSGMMSKLGDGVDKGGGGGDIVVTTTMNPITTTKAPVTTVHSHVYNALTGKCTSCGALHEHTYDSLTGKCLGCMYEHVHTYSTTGKCSVCKYQCPHSNYNDSGKCVKCSYQCPHDDKRPCVSSVDPTCTKVGNTSGEYCHVCFLTLEYPKEIPAKGHNIVDGKCQGCGMSPTAGDCEHGVQEEQCEICNPSESGETDEPDECLHENWSNGVCQGCGWAPTAGDCEHGVQGDQCEICNS